MLLCHLLCVHCKELQLCLGVLFFVMSLTAKLLRKAGHCTTGAWTIPVLPEGGRQAMLQNGSQTFRWHLGLGKKEATSKRFRPPWLSFQPHDWLSLWLRPATSTSGSSVSPHATGRGWELLPDTSLLPDFGTAAQQGLKALPQHTCTHTNQSVIGVLYKLTWSFSGLFEVQGNTSYISKQH